MDLEELMFLKEGLMNNGLSQEDYDTIEEMLENGDTWFDPAEMEIPDPDSEDWYPQDTP